MIMEWQLYRSIWYLYSQNHLISFMAPTSIFFLLTISRTLMRCTRRWLWSCILTREVILRNSRNCKRWRQLGLLGQGWGRCASFLLNQFWSFLWDGDDDDDDEEESWTMIHLSHSGSSFSTPLQERLTEIEKEEGEGEKKDTVDDPEEEDRAPFFKTKSKVIRWKPTCNPHHVRWVWGFEVVLFSRKIHHGG